MPMALRAFVLMCGKLAGRADGRVLAVAVCSRVSGRRPCARIAWASAIPLSLVNGLFRFSSDKIGVLYTNTPAAHLPRARCCSRARARARRAHTSVYGL